ncbi:UDP-N-acetylglucosamine transferase subunit [Coemansia sp. RSA 2322]|uniref:UDP-N-acetylglucosamine transferase subunit ALG14 n=1 Tax=Coemansia thaxteri TaxID=2663907 RepID=A0A9W8BGZ5_9FUNG|nr:UDP-N-acetylglucosamine transferase subunit [Coemansia thaxteri]KAJ2471325.1 UDP-N-acetylglucosamine transferase subunit [Coemansia sp. RSA 2322]
MSLLLVAAAAATVLALRLYFVLPVFSRRQRSTQDARKRKGKKPVRSSAQKSLCVVLGSGGHTAEMTRLLSGVDYDRYTRRLYVVGDTDVISLNKIGSIEASRGSVWEEYYVGRVPRSRMVGQSWISTPLSVLRCFAQAACLVYRHLPDAVLCNGPGNCVVVCLAAIIVRVLGIKKITIIYVESFARVHTLSLSGKLMYLLADRFIVQWPSLLLKHPRAEYIPNLV